MSNKDYVQTVRDYAKAVLQHGRDVYGEEETPLLADGINVATGEPLYWNQDGRMMIMSNFARQQIIVRTFLGLSELTGEHKYASTVSEIAGYMFDRHQQPGGLLPWGTHLFIDLADKKFHDLGKGLNHELHGWFPVFDFLWDVNQEATERLIKGTWNAHVCDWGKLIFNRHGDVTETVDFSNVWDHDFEHPTPLIETRGKLTFISCGAQIIDAGARLYMLNQDAGAWKWAKRLNDLYIAARHPETKLGCFQYTTPIAQKQLPPIEELLSASGSNAPSYTYSGLGDRAKNVFGADFGEIAREAYLLARGEATAVYGVSATAMLRMGAALGEAGKSFITEQVEGLKAYARHAYLPEENKLKPIWTDGTDLTGYRPPWPGYYRGLFATGSGTMEPWDVSTWMGSPGMHILFSYCVAYRYTKDDELWQTLRSLLRGLGCGDVGTASGKNANLPQNLEISDPILLLSILELYEATGVPEYLRLAEDIGVNIAARFENGLIIDPESKDADFCQVEPYALIRLEGVRKGMADRIPSFVSHNGRVYN